MPTYNPHLRQLVLPEYGRNIQQMVDHCMTIEDRDERTRCAYAIVKAMSILFPQSKNDDAYEVKFWDHLNIMSGFALDIDWPYEVIKREEIEPKPEPLDYDMSGVKRRSYGGNIERMIDIVSDMEPSADRDQLVRMLANQKKKDLLVLNPDDDPDERVYHDFYEMSKGRIRIDSQTTPLFEYSIVAPVSGKKKKKK